MEGTKGDDNEIIAQDRGKIPAAWFKLVEKHEGNQDEVTSLKSYSRRSMTLRSRRFEKWRMPTFMLNDTLGQPAERESENRWEPRQAGHQLRSRPAWRVRPCISLSLVVFGLQSLCLRTDSPAASVRFPETASLAIVGSGLLSIVYRSACIWWIYTLRPGVRMRGHRGDLYRIFSLQIVHQCQRLALECA